MYVLISSKGNAEYNAKHFKDSNVKKKEFLPA